MLNGKEDEEMLSESQQLLDFAETGSGSVANTPRSPWGTCEDLLLASAVLKHGTSNWRTVSGELQDRALVLSASPALFSDEACKCRFLTLNGRFASCASSSSRNDSLENPIPLFEELRKLRVAQLKRELEHYDGSIGSLQRKLKRLKAERAQSTLVHNPGVKQSADKDPSDHDSQRRSFDDAAQTVESSQTSTVEDGRSLSGVAERLPKDIRDNGESLQGFFEVASEHQGSRDDHSKRGEATVDVADALHQADCAERPLIRYRCSLAHVADSHPSFESSKDYGVLGVPELPFAVENNPGSSDAGVQKCRTATKAGHPFEEPAGIEKGEESVEAIIPDAVVDKGKKIQELELPTVDGLQAEVQLDSVNKDPEIGGPARDSDVSCRSGKVEADFKEADTLVEHADSSPLLPTETSVGSSVERDGEKDSRAVGIIKDPLRFQGLERASSSGANAMDLLRLAYGSAQDANPVCTPEAAEPQPQVESEKVMELDSVFPPGIAAATPAFLATAGDFSFITDKSRQFDPNASGADGNCANAGSSEEVNNNQVPTLVIDGVLNRVSNEDICVNAVEVTAGVEVTVVERHVEEPKRNPDMVGEPDRSLGESFSKCESVTEPMVGEVCEDDPVLSTSGNISSVQSLSVPSHQEKELCGICLVQVPNTEAVAVAILGQCGSEQKLGFVQGHKPVLKQEVPYSDNNFDEETEVQSHDGNVRNCIDDAGSPTCEREPGLIEELSEPPKDVAPKTAKPESGTFLAGTGLSIPSVDVETKVILDVTEEDGLLRDVMMLKPIKLSNLRKRQMLCNGGSHTGGFRNHMTPKEGRESLPETVTGKRVKLEDVMENITSQPEGASETNLNSTVKKEESAPLKPRQFKLRSGRLKGFLKNSERVAAAAYKVPESEMLDSSGTRRSDGCAAEPFPTQSTCPGLNKNGLSREEIITEESEAQECGTPAPKTTDEDLEEGMQDLRDDKESQLEKAAEIATPVNDEKSPPSKRGRAEIQSLPLLECLHIIGAHRFAPLFKWRQESQDNDRYKCLIRRHMDLNIVTSQLEEGMYTGSLEFFRDLLLIFNNALVFYSRDSQEYGAARVLRECVMREMEKTLQTEAPQKISGRTTRKREAKKVGEEANAGLAAPTSEGKRRGSLRSSSSDHAGSAAISDGGICTRGADLGLERPSSVSRDSEVENSVQAKELESDEKEQGGKDVSKSYTRSKTKAKVQASEEDRMEKSSVQKRKDYKEKNSRSPDNMSLRVSVKKEVLSTNGLRNSSQNSLKIKEQASKNDSDTSKTAKSLSGRQSTVPQGETRKTSGGRPPRSSQSMPPVIKGNQSSFQSQKRGRT